MVDVGDGIAFLERSRSKLLRAAADWIVHYDDPVDVLFVLSRDTADAMGPWETFRYAALLGLVQSPAVSELGLDVLVEPVDADSKTPPVEQAMALGHAFRAFPEEDAPYLGDVQRALDERKPLGFHAAVVDSARLVIAARAGADREALKERLAQHLDAEDGVQVASTIFEALCLADEQGELRERALARVSEGQADDGGLTAQIRNDVIRGLTTLRVLCLLRPPGTAS